MSMANGGGRKCTYDEVLHALHTSNESFWPTDDHNEVYPGIVIGSGVYARNLDILRQDGITHVLNAARGSHLFPDADTSPSHYKLSNIQFLGAEIIDLDHFDITPHFITCNTFIDDALSKNGKVLVHCMQGISRSATIVLAYLIMVKQLSLIQAINIVRRKRPIMPNPGFLKQLIDLNNRTF